MAKKSTIDEGLFKSTAPKEEPKEEKKNFPVSVYLTREEKNELDQMAKEVGMSRHALLQFSIRDFMRRFKAGEIKTAEKTVTVTVLKAE